ncbi:hypothetical protein DFH09DRAFT_1290189 [Mycena vulgaris]|nr:hypothetical protein DFH09DRAFT_1290189 [Mycena vulgaris]
MRSRGRRKQESDGAAVGRECPTISPGAPSLPVLPLPAHTRASSRQGRRHSTHPAPHPPRPLTVVRTKRVPRIRTRENSLGSTPLAPPLAERRHRRRAASASSAARHARVHSAQSTPARAPRFASVRARSAWAPHRALHHVRIRMSPYAVPLARPRAWVPHGAASRSSSPSGAAPPPRMRPRAPKSKGSAEGAPLFKPSTLFEPTPFSTPFSTPAPPRDAQDDMTAPKTKRSAEEAPARVQAVGAEGDEDVDGGVGERTGTRRRGGRRGGRKQRKKGQRGEHGVREEARGAGIRRVWMRGGGTRTRGERMGMAGRRDGGKATQKQEVEVWGGRRERGRSAREDEAERRRRGGKGDMERGGREVRGRTMSWAGKTQGRKRRWRRREGSGRGRGTATKDDREGRWSCDGNVWVTKRRSGGATSALRKVEGGGEWSTSRGARAEE